MKAHSYRADADPQHAVLADEFFFDLASILRLLIHRNCQDIDQELAQSLDPGTVKAQLGVMKSWPREGHKSLADDQAVNLFIHMRLLEAELARGFYARFVTTASQMIEPFITGKSIRDASRLVRVWEGWGKPLGGSLPDKSADLERVAYLAGRTALEHFARLAGVQPAFLQTYRSLTQLLNREEPTEGAV